MGVPGLTTFIEAHPELLVPLKLQNRSVVINGNGLVHWLFYYHKQNFKFGVNYKDFEELCTKFLETLNVCKIEAYILFDGALEKGKFQKFIEHNEKRMKQYSQVVRGSKFQLLSGFAYAVFTEVARKFRVPFCCCDSEADREVVLLANALNCPVLGDDGDFFIFNITAGLITWKTFKWKRVLSDGSTAKHCVPCKVFNQRRFCKKFTIRKSLLPLMACLLGNDRVFGEDTNFFYCHLRRVGQSGIMNITKKGEIDAGPKKTNPSNVLKVIEWLRKYPSSDTALHDVLEMPIKSNRENVRRKIESAIQMYRLDDCESKFKNYLGELRICTNYKNVKPPELDMMNSLPDWFLVLFRMGALQPKFINVIFQRNYFTHLFVEDNRKPSCNRSSLRIRKAIFGILLKDDDVQRECDTVGSKKEQQESHRARSGQSSQFDDEKPCKSQQKKSVVQYDRLDADKTVTPTPIAPLEQLESYGPLPDLLCIPKLSDAKRKSLFIEILGLDLASVTALPPDYQLPIAVTVHCMKNSDPQVSTEQLLAVLLCFVRGHMCDSFQSENTSGVLAKVAQIKFQSDPVDCQPYKQTAEAAARCELDERQTSFLGTKQEMKIKSKMPSPCASTDPLHEESTSFGKLHINSDPSVKFGRISDRHLSLVQTCAQWQSCMQYATYLNTILQDPFPTPDITKLYHGTEISATYYELIDLDLPKQIDWINRYLQMIPKSKNAAETFDQMYEVVTNCCKEVDQQLPDIGRLSQILEKDFPESAVNVSKDV